MENTRDVKGRREEILRGWFDELIATGEWKRFTNNSGKLIVAAALRQLHKIETGRDDGSWDGNSYFKSSHWSHKLRAAFEDSVLKERSKLAGFDLLGAPLDENLGLPLWLDDVPLRQDVRDVLVELAEGRKQDRVTIKELRGRLDKRDQKILELETRQRNLDQRYTAIEGHYMDSVRTFRYVAGDDIDLSQGGLFEGDDQPS